MMLTRYSADTCAAARSVDARRDAAGVVAAFGVDGVCIRRALSVASDDAEREPADSTL